MTQATSSPTRSSARPSSSATYRPFLDGLRAVAVYLVVLFHAGSERFAGGFVGVDVFFVLSGFLVTQLLLRDVDANGSVRFGRFYARRFRRLLPAAFVVLIVTALAYTALASPIEVADAEDAFKAAFLYVTNWYFIDQSTDYFGADLSSNPVLHFWSLAVEEQFYLLWPVVLTGLLAATRRFGARQRDAVRWLVLLGAVASVWWAWSLRDSNPSRAYYGTDARAYQLMAGALLALTPGLWPRLRTVARWFPAVAVAAVLALVLVASSASDGLDPIERGMAATVVTVVLLVALEGADRGPARRALSVTPMVYLGRVSYGTYLWHWPVVLLLTHYFDLSTLSTVAWTVLVATALASLSFELLEHPIRLSPLLDRHRGPVIAVGLAVSVVSALVIIPAVVSPSDASSAASPGEEVTVDGFTPVPEDIDFEEARSIPPPTGCLDEPASACTLVTGSGAHVLLMGDSHAAMLIPMFRAIAEEHDLTLSVSTRGGCPWQRNLIVSPVFAGGGAQPQDACQEHREDTYERVIPELDPDVIVGINFAYETPDQYVLYLGPDRELLPLGSEELDSWIEETTVSSLDQLEADGRSVVLLEPIPYQPGLDTLACLSEASVVEECRQVVEPGPSSVESLYRRLDEERPTMWSADLDPLVCPFLPICDPIVDGIVVKADGNHLTRAFSTAMAPAVSDYLVDNGILEP